MEGTMEMRLVNMMREIKELKKDLISQKVANVKTIRGRMNRWQALGSRVSSQWDGVSAVEEVSQQREKTP
jgi:hypothetical protein